MPTYFFLRLALTVVALGPQNQPPGRIVTSGAVSNYSIPVSPSVVASVTRQGEKLLLLILWRGESKWYNATPRRDGGGGGETELRGHLVYGPTELNYTFDGTRRRFVLNNVTTTVPEGTNVILVDHVGKPPFAIKALVVDVTGVNANIRQQSIAPLLTKSREVSAFLQCDQREVVSVGICAEVRKLVGLSK